MKILEHKSTITEIKNSLYRFSTRVNMTKGRMHELEDRTIEITQSE